MLLALPHTLRQNKLLSNALRIAFEGAVLLFEHNENGSAGDLCGLYCSGLDEVITNDQYEKLIPKIHDQIQKLHMFTLTNLTVDQPDRDQFEKRVVTWSATRSEIRFGSPILRGIIGENYWSYLRDYPLSPSEKIYYYRLAGNNYLFASDGIKFAEFLIEMSQYCGTKQETQFFCMQSLFQLLCRQEFETGKNFLDTFCRRHPEISTFPYTDPLLNLGHYLLLAIDSQNQKAFLVLFEVYEPILRLPDPSLKHYMEKIGAVYFGMREEKKPATGFMGMLQNLMSDFGDGDPHSEGEMNEEPNLNSLMSMANNMLGSIVQQNAPTETRKPASPQLEENDDLD